MSESCIVCPAEVLASCLHHKNVALRVRHCVDAVSHVVASVVPHTRAS